LVDPYSIHSSYFKKIRDISHEGPVYSRPCRIVHIALAALFIYGVVIKLFDLSEPGLHRNGGDVSEPFPTGPGISRKSI
jgi:hypothetical protein